MLEHITKSRVPCALKNYAYEVDGHISSRQISLSERQLAFEHWVAYNSNTISKAISIKGDFVCPLLPCLKHFESLDSCLRHLLDCSSLLGGHYWCPFCWDKENFANPGLIRSDNSRSPALKKSSRLKRAISFVKRFGRISSGPARISINIGPFHNLSQPNKLSDRCQPQLLEEPELLEEPQLLDGSQILELPVTEFQVLELSGWRQSQLIELSVERETRGRSSVEYSANDAPQIETLEDSNRDGLVVSPLFSFNSPNRMFEAIRKGVDDLHQSWMSRLSFRSRYGPDVRFSLSTPFENGIRSLQEFYRSGLPRTFEDTFALMHVAYACASIYVKKDERHFWHSFFLDVLRWHSAIATQEDKELFVDAAFLIWCPPDYSVVEAKRDSGDLLSQLGLLTSCQLDYSQPLVMSPTGLGEEHLSRLHDILREGQVIKFCTRYLDDFEDANICSRNAAGTTQPSWNSETSLESPISMKSGQAANCTDSPVTALSSSTLLGSSEFSGNDDNATLVPSSTSSPVDPLSPTSNSTLYCPICYQPFNAKNDQDQRSNLKRHTFTKHTPHRVHCSDPGCDKIFNRRDNMLRHCRNDHKSREEEEDH